MDGGAWWATSHRVAKSQTRLSAFTSLHFNRIDNSNRGGSKKGKKSKRIYRSSQSIRIINVFLESLLSESFPSLRVTVHLTSLGCPPTLCWSLALLLGSSDSNLVLLLCVLSSDVLSYQN